MNKELKSLFIGPVNHYRRILPLVRGLVQQVFLVIPYKYNGTAFNVLSGELPLELSRGFH